MSVESGGLAVLELLRKAQNAGKSDDAMRWSQAAVNAAHALSALRDAER